MPISKEQEEEFKKRRAQGSTITDAERDAFNQTKKQFTKKEYLSFLKSTDEKLK